MSAEEPPGVTPGTKHTKHAKYTLHTLNTLHTKSTLHKLHNYPITPQNTQLDLLLFISSCTCQLPSYIAGAAHPALVQNGGGAGEMEGGEEGARQKRPSGRAGVLEGEEGALQKMASGGRAGVLEEGEEGARQKRPRSSGSNSDSSSSSGENSHKKAKVAFYFICSLLKMVSSFSSFIV